MGRNDLLSIYFTDAVGGILKCFLAKHGQLMRPIRAVLVRKELRPEVKCANVKQNHEQSTGKMSRLTKGLRKALDQLIIEIRHTARPRFHLTESVMG